MIIQNNNFLTPTNSQVANEPNLHLAHIVAVAGQILDPNEVRPAEEGNVGEEAPDYTDIGPIEEANSDG